MSYTVTHLIPQLPILDMVAAKRFYEQELGCRLESEYDDLLIYELEGQIVHFWLCQEKSIPESSSLYAIVEGIEALYEKYKGRASVALPLCAQPWGMKEFYIMDNSGNLLKFGERIKA